MLSRSWRRKSRLRPGPQGRDCPNRACPSPRRCRSLARSETSSRQGTNNSTGFLDAQARSRAYAPPALDGPTDAPPASIASISVTSRVIAPLLFDAGRYLAKQRFGQHFLLQEERRKPLRPVSIVRTPQEISKPTPPAETPLACAQFWSSAAQPWARAASALSWRLVIGTADRALRAYSSS